METWGGVRRRGRCLDRPPSWINGIIHVQPSRTGSHLGYRGSGMETWGGVRRWRGWLGKLPSWIPASFTWAGHWAAILDRQPSWISGDTGWGYGGRRWRRCLDRPPSWKPASVTLAGHSGQPSCKGSHLGCWRGIGKGWGVEGRLKQWKSLKSFIFRYCLVYLSKKYTAYIISYIWYERRQKIVQNISLILHFVQDFRPF